MKADAQVAIRGASEVLADTQPGGRLSDLAYTRLLESLFDRRLPAGAFVSQNDLVKLLGIPVAPLRDALRTLEVEGILTIHPRSGIQFVKPGLELTKSTYQFRTIIERAAVRTFAELAPERMDDPEFRSTFFSVAQNEINRINKLVDDLLSLSKPADAVLEDVDVNDVCRQVVHQASAFRR